MTLAICVKGLERNRSLVTHEDSMDTVLKVQAKKKTNLNYYA